MYHIDPDCLHEGIIGFRIELQCCLPMAYGIEVLLLLQAFSCGF